MPGPLTPRDPGASLRTKRGFNRVAGQEQNVGTFFAGPAVAPVLPPTFRAIVAADIAAPFTILLAAGIAAALPLTTKGDILVWGTGLARQPVGIDYSAPFADSTQATGLSYKSGVVTVNSQFTAVTAGVAATTMMQYGIPAGLLATNGDYLEVIADFSFAAGGGVQAIIISFGNQTLSTLTPSGAAGSMGVRLLIQRIDATHQNCLVEVWSGLIAGGELIQVATGTQDLSIGLGIKFTASDSNGLNHLFQNVMIVRFSKTA